MNKNSRILVIGANGMVGSAVVRLLNDQGYNFVETSTRSDTNLLDRKQVSDLYRQHAPEYVFMCAAKVGGIKANNEMRVEFLEQNTLIAINTISEAYNHDVKKLLFLGSSCVYPKHARQPIKETELLTGPLEYTNEPYALAKIIGLKLCENYSTQYGKDFISCMPCNLFGQGDNYDLETSHVMAAMIRKIHEAKENDDPKVVFWGTGQPMREFLYVDDVADALVFLMKNYSDVETINIGANQDYYIKSVALLVAQVVGYEGTIKFDMTGADGTPKKKVDTSKMVELGWAPSISIKGGIEKAYEHYKQTLK